MSEIIDNKPKKCAMCDRSFFGEKKVCPICHDKLKSNAAKGREALLKNKANDTGYFKRLGQLGGLKGKGGRPKKLL
jgi:predicted amidophosphoribosyltransferase